MADRVREPYAAPGQQREAAMMGMYVFLTSETMLFSGLFLVAPHIRLEYPADIVAASRQMHYFIGAANTALLLTSSLLVALAVEAARKGRARPAPPPPRERAAPPASTCRPAPSSTCA